MANKLNAIIAEDGLGRLSGQEQQMILFGITFSSPNNARRD